MINILKSLEKRRTYYSIRRELPVSIDEVVRLMEQLTESVPDAFNMKSSRVVVVSGEMQDRLWNRIYDVFEGKVAREKIDGFRTGAGTILYFYDGKVVEGMMERFATYADNFPVWANRSSGMLQLAVWSGLRELNIGASLQHYNPVIDDAVKELLGLPKEWVLVAQMPFGGIGEEPAPKEKEKIEERVRDIRD